MTLNSSRLLLFDSGFFNAKLDIVNEITFIFKNSRLTSFLYEANVLEISFLLLFKI